MNDLDGTTVVITGAAKGLGRAFTEGFLADGANVVGTDVDEDGLAAIAAQGAVTARCDVSVDADVRAMIDLAVAETGRVDVLSNNARDPPHRSRARRSTRRVGHRPPLPLRRLDGPPRRPARH